jgi:hypothetical protein
MTKSPLNHIVVVLAILTATAAVYCHVTASYYCNDDDFMEVHRAAFVDARDPMTMFTTVHFGSFRYRPLSRAMTLLTYLAGHGRPEAFPVRNLSVAPMAIVLGSMLYDFCDAKLFGKPLFLLFTMFIAVVFALGTGVRNNRVAACGATAHRILAAISFEGLSNRASMAFADAPGEDSAEPYGFYRFSGLNTVASRIGTRSQHLQCAVQLLTGNDKITAEVVHADAPSPIESGNASRRYDTLIVVHADGSIIQQNIESH